MALSIKDDETERLARSLAARRGAGITHTIRLALHHEQLRLDRNDQIDERRFDVAVMRARQMIDRNVENQFPTNDEILGYGEHGVPLQR